MTDSVLEPVFYQKLQGTETAVIAAITARKRWKTAAGF
jgi:hypothetical protein